MIAQSDVARRATCADTSCMPHVDVEPMKLLSAGIPLSLLIDLAFGPPDVADVVAESLGRPFDIG